jgi:hypothetical protein
MARNVSNLTGQSRARRFFESGPYRRIPTPDIVNGLREGVLTRE